MKKFANLLFYAFVFVAAQCASTELLASEFEVTTVVVPEDIVNQRLGSIRVTATGSVPPYTFVLRNGVNQTQTSNGTAVFANLSAGTYSLTVTCDAGCVVTRSIVVPCTRGLVTTTTTTTASAARSAAIANFITTAYCGGGCSTPAA